MKGKILRKSLAEQDRQSRVIRDERRCATLRKLQAAQHYTRRVEREAEQAAIMDYLRRVPPRRW